MRRRGECILCRKGDAVLGPRGPICAALKACFRRREDARREREAHDGVCSARIQHGPGHQSATNCHRGRGHSGKHCATYGSHGLHAVWSGAKASSGYFDDRDDEECLRSSL
jgi:hypothetical protein